MKGLNTSSVAILFLVLGNFFASLSDVAIKLLDGGVSPWQYVFVRQCLSALILFPWWLKLSSDKQKLTGFKVTLARSQLVLIGSGCMMVAVTYLPLATANAVIYAAPLLMLPLSLFLLGERPTLLKTIATSIGFIGVLIVLRPSQFHWAALFALGTATTLALFNILVRKIPNEQPVIATLFWTSLLSLPIAGLGALMTWQPMSIKELGWICSSAVLILSYNGLAVLAYKRAQATQIALAEYSGLVFVAIFGVVWFNEIPDAFTIIGILLILLPILPWKHPRYWKVGKRLLTSTKTTVRKTEEHH
ncbi:DMT family transporter [Vibrio sonorensis]|uniref:DMT family transporter n=1 Tax=Vibrio sonorensis TaxID=1004316 RepID=UPI0008DA2CF1|nr:DMT family transporter [Vibrio sonorensis]